MISHEYNINNLMAGRLPKFNPQRVAPATAAALRPMLSEHFYILWNCWAQKWRRNLFCLTSYERIWFLTNCVSFTFRLAFRKWHTPPLMEHAARLIFLMGGKLRAFRLRTINRIIACSASLFVLFLFCYIFLLLFSTEL